MNRLAKAISITAQAFEDKTDKGGNPYVLHCLRVMQSLSTENEDIQCAAVMHDLIEDTSYTIQRLQEIGFSWETINLVSVLTHTKNDSYDEYIKRISNIPNAVKIKLSDLRDNSDITRLKGLTKKDFDRIEKYHRSYTYLSKL